MGSIQHCESSIFETVAMWSMREWLRTLGLDHHNPGNNDPQVVEKKFRDYIRHCRPGAEELKSINGFRDDWRQMFGHGGARDFEEADAEHVRFQHCQDYAIQKIKEMMQAEEEAEKRRQEASRGDDAGARGSQEAAVDATRATCGCGRGGQG